MDIGKIDENFRVCSEFDKPDAVYRDCREKPFSIHGLMWENDGFCRLPEKIAANTNEGVKILARHTAGGRIRFRTDSSYVVLSCQMPVITRFPHMPLFGTTGFDLYADGIFWGTFRMHTELKDGYDAVVELGEKKMREIEIGFPLYNEVSSVKIGLEGDARLEAPKEYTVKTPVVYYGSSITQGGCVSRPGLSYPSLISTELDVDYINLGFSGSARGEQIMADYIATLKQSVFVLDYDHNAPTVEHLEQTHEAFYKTVREKNPDLPIVMVTRPAFKFDRENATKRRNIVRTTYENAKNAGDTKVWFIDGETLWGEEHWDACTMDKCHPNDLGHFRMAQVIGKVVKEILFDK